MELIAVDISKDKLDVLYDSSGRHTVIKNSKKDIAKLITDLKMLSDVWLVFEATGGYDRLLKQTALDNKIKCSICTGLRVREFARSQGRLAKTDKLDTSVIAEYAKATDLPIVESRDQSVENLKILSTRRKQILDLILQEENKQEHDLGQVISKSILTVIKCLKKELENIETQLDNLIESNSVLKDKKQLLETIPGVGRIAAITLLANLPELGTLSRSKIASLAGLAPMNQDSGKFHGRRKTRRSRCQIKRDLYLGALSAAKHNPVIKPFYSRLKEKGKPTKLVLVACMRKIVLIANAILKNQEEFREKAKSRPLAIRSRQSLIN